MWARLRGIAVAVVLLAGLLSGGLQPADADTITVGLEPGRLVGGVGDTVVVAVRVDGAVDLGAFEFHLGYDPAILQATGAELGAFLASTGRTPVPLGPALREGEIRFGRRFLWHGRRRGRWRCTGPGHAARCWRWNHAPHLQPRHRHRRDGSGVAGGCHRRHFFDGSGFLHLGSAPTGAQIGIP